MNCGLEFVILAIFSVSLLTFCVKCASIEVALFARRFLTSSIQKLVSILGKGTNFMSKLYYGLPYRDDQLNEYVRENGLPWFRVGMMLIHHDGSVLLVKKSVNENDEKKEMWGLPFTRCRIGESFLQAAMRELKETTPYLAASNYDIVCMKQKCSADDPHVSMVISCTNYIENSDNREERGNVGWMSYSRLMSLMHDGKLDDAALISQALTSYVMDNKKPRYGHILSACTYDEES